MLLHCSEKETIILARLNSFFMVILTHFLTIHSHYTRSHMARPSVRSHFAFFSLLCNFVMKYSIRYYCTRHENLAIRLFTLSSSAFYTKHACLSMCMRKRFRKRQTPMHCISFECWLRLQFR